MTAFVVIATFLPLVLAVILIPLGVVLTLSSPRMRAFGGGTFVIGGCYFGMQLIFLSATTSLSKSLALLTPRAASVGWAAAGFTCAVVLILWGRTRIPAALDRLSPASSLFTNPQWGDAVGWSLAVLGGYYGLLSLAVLLLWR
jgi:hypothetical protein